MKNCADCALLCLLNGAHERDWTSSVTLVNGQVYYGSVTESTEVAFSAATGCHP